MRLSVNIDHVATVRQARRAREPEPVAAALLCELAGAEGITVHLRGDRRHINDRDVEILRQVVSTKLNVEMAATPEMTAIAARIRPDQVTLVPERAGGAEAAEINTGPYTSARAAGRASELTRVVAAARAGVAQGLEVLGGHGLTYVNVRPIAAIPDIVELPIGHTIVARPLPA